ncbi:hypothetical protein ACFY93_26750 [Streptomyces sp. NPDC008313]|uniref:SCO4402 family protein n=1 Tax=Streptomyces sp. NPDC008313 TaxID=3364826 RepID=UPI0036DFFD18
MEFSELITVTLPEMRKSVLSAVRALSDKAYQERVWLDHDYPQEGYYDDFSMNIHILFDDTLVLDDPAASLGTVLKCQEEVEVMASLAAALENLFDREGGQREDLDYVRSPLWDAVVRCASRAHFIMTQ